MPFVKIFQWKCWHFAPLPASIAYSQNFFNEIVKNSNSWKFRPTKINISAIQYTVNSELWYSPKGSFKPSLMHSISDQWFMIVLTPMLNVDLNWIRMQSIRSMNVTCLCIHCVAVVHVRCCSACVIGGGLFHRVLLPSVLIDRLVCPSDSPDVGPFALRTAELFAKHYVMLFSLCTVVMVCEKTTPSPVLSPSCPSSLLLVLPPSSLSFIPLVFPPPFSPPC